MKQASASLAENVAAKSGRGANKVLMLRSAHCKCHLEVVNSNMRVPCSSTPGVIITAITANMQYRYRSHNRVMPACESKHVSMAGRQRKQAATQE